MLFSIIIPTLNEELELENCLLALQILRQQAEIIVVDGGSSDHTLRLATPLVDQVLSSNQGRALQMNFGATHAHGEILIFLHADTYLPANALLLISQQLNEKCWGRFNINLIGSHRLLPLIAWFMNARSRLTGIATGDQVIFVTCTAFHKINGYPIIALMEDIGVCQRLKKLSPPLCLTAKVQSSARRWQQFGVFKTILLMWRLRLGYFLGENPDKLALMYQQGRCWLLKNR